MVSPYSDTAMDVLSRAENFWERFEAPSNPYDLVKYSILMGLLPFSGFFFHYAVLGKIWNVWPWVQSILPVLRALMCALLQWIFFATFPILSAMLIEFLFKWLHPPSLNSCTIVSTYSLTPLCLTSLFVSVPFFNQILPVLSFSTFLYLLFTGYRIYLRQGIAKSAVFTLVTGALFASIRQIFVFVIGF
jgi:hypothetical protein